MTTTLATTTRRSRKTVARTASPSWPAYRDPRLTYERDHPTEFTATVTATNESPWSFDLAAPNLALAQSDAAWRVRDLAHVPGLLVTVAPKTDTAETSVNA